MGYFFLSALSATSPFTIPYSAFTMSYVLALLLMPHAPCPMPKP
ncbi:hypothetical protein [Nostoc linckia]|nr:hypothetical protein [Nostoc linckia]